MAQRSLQVVIYREDEAFVAQCLNVDVASDGSTAQEAREKPARGLGAVLRRGRRRR